MFEEFITFFCERSLIESFYQLSLIEQLSERSFMEPCFLVLNPFTIITHHKTKMSSNKWPPLALKVHIFLTWLIKEAIQFV